MATAVLSPACDGVVRIGDPGARELAFRIGEDLPYADGAVTKLAIGESFDGLALPAKVSLLLECRRVLAPGGRIDIEGTHGIEGARPGLGVADIAALVGLRAVDEERCAESPTGKASARPAPLGFTRANRILHGDPLVSIAIPAYSPRFLLAALECAIGQTYDNVEIVVCDDSEGTEVERIVAGCARRRPIRYERNEARLRPRGNFVRCFERSAGEFVKFLCDDDLLAPACVERLLDAFRRAPDVTLATSHRVRIDANATLLGDQPATQPIVAVDSVIAGHTLANAVLMAGLNRIGEPSTAMFRKADFSEAGPGYFHFLGTPGHGIIDLVMWTALLMKGNGVYLCDSLSAFRIHPGQRQHDPSKLDRNVESIRSLQAAWLSLRLFERVPPHLLLAKPFPPGETAWSLQPVLGMAAHPVA